MTDKELKTIRAVKNRLCRIEDDINRVMTQSKEHKKELILASSDIDGCVFSLEKLLTN